jgi:hypothetical protein
MSVRRCATEGCLGTLPRGIGKHCPRCGGTAFIRPRPRGRRVLLITLVVLAGIAGTRFFRSVRLRSTVSNERRALIQAHDLAARMTGINAQDDAYAQILHRALAQHDFEYACEIGDEMTQLSAKDKCLLETVDEALKAHEPAWANHAADEIVEISIRDEAFRKIMDSAAPK